MKAASAAEDWRSALSGWTAFPFILFAFAVIAQVAGDNAAIFMGLIFFIVGLAHGAGDEQCGELRPYSVIPALAYVVTGMAVAALMIASPLGGLTAFIMLSAWHFAHSIHYTAAGKYGFALTAVGGSALWQSEATSAVFAGILGIPIPQLWTVALALAGLAGLVLAVYSLLHQNWDPSLIIAILATAALHPVLAVGLIFASGHAFPIQSQQIRRYGWLKVIKAEGPTTLLALMGTLGIAVLVHQNYVGLPLAAAFAVGMATPHMLAERLER